VITGLSRVLSKSRYRGEIICATRVIRGGEGEKSKLGVHSIVKEGEPGRSISKLQRGSCANRDGLRELPYTPLGGGRKKERARKKK